MLFSYIDSLIFFGIFFLMSVISYRHWSFLKFLILFEYLSLLILFICLVNMSGFVFFVFMIIAVCEAVFGLCLLVSSSMDYLQIYLKKFFKDYFLFKFKF